MFLLFFPTCLWKFYDLCAALLLVSAFAPSCPGDNIRRREFLSCNCFKTIQGKKAKKTPPSSMKPHHKLLGQHHQYLPSTCYLFNRDSSPYTVYSNCLLFLQWSLAIVTGRRLRIQKLTSHNPLERSKKSSWILLSCNK